MHKRFVFAIEDQPGEDWLSRFATGRDEAVRWYLGSQPAEPPTAAECRAALREYMPELLSHYDRACALVGDDDMAHRVLSHYRPAPTLDGCSQAVWFGDGGPALVRNYDYRLDVISDRFELTRWAERRVIAKAQRPWGGCLDGMNDQGLVASQTAGGGQGRGLGFSIILVLRYVLETCKSVDEAIAVLSRIPVALSQNVTLLDRSGNHASIFLGPGRAPAVSSARVCTNHQEMPRQPASFRERSSIERQQLLLDALDDPAMTLDRLAAKFFAPPVYSRRSDSTTAYTAIYRPTEGRVDYLWPGRAWSQRLDQFTSGEYIHDYGDLSL